MNPGRLALGDPIEALRGIGPGRAEAFARAGIRCIGDLLRRAPRGFEDRGHPLSIRAARERPAGTFVAVRGRVAKRSFLRFGGRSTLRVILEDDTGTLEILWFHAGPFAKRVAVGGALAVSGRITEKRTLLHPEFERLSDAASPCPARFLGVRPVHSAVEGVSARRVTELVHGALARLARVDDPLPKAIREEAGVLALDAALRAAHAPCTVEEARAGQERLLFDELLAIESALLERVRSRGARRRNPPHGRTGGASEFLDRLPFAATESQRDAALEIAGDFEAGAPVERLLAGEVGSGKTVVALAACEEARARGFQSAFLAPTALLAAQHLRVARELLEGSGAHVALLTGSLPGEEASAVRADLARGAIDLVVGTHALFSKATRFRRLGLAVIDEQHRFGVDQRESLARKGEGVVVLGMSATPIPRSLALLAVPGWDVTLLESRPEARGDVSTRIVPEAKRGDANVWIAERLRGGEQAIFVRPRIEGEEEGAVALHRELAAGPIGALGVGLVHGGLREEARAESLRRFAQGTLRALVATTIVEVGIDVPGAAILWIEGAERFGLAQLHQLRGRIARRGQKGYCFLVPSAPTETASARLRILRTVSDGLQLATIDLAERGPGELLGQRQSGESSLGASGGVAADPEALLALMERARRAARSLAGEDPLPGEASTRCQGVIPVGS